MTLPTLTENSEFYDNSSIVPYKECPRKYQLRHMLHWRSTGISLPLTFGLSWHAGQDALWAAAKKFDDKGRCIQFALAGFLTCWEEQGLPTELDIEQIDLYEPRTPMIAHEMYKAYLDSRWEMIRKSELISSEQPFAVPVPGLEDTWYVGRLDKVIEFNGEKLIIEHKTTTEYKKDGGFKIAYIQSWFTDSQVKGYQFGGSLYYPGLNQVWVDAALVHKQVHNAFRFVPVMHQFPLLAEWVNDTRDWIERIKADKKRGYFPKNENSCIGKYGPCPYLNICRTTSDPESLTEPPEGYMVEKWEPFNVLQLDKLIREDRA